MNREQESITTRRMQTGRQKASRACHSALALILGCLSCAYASAGIDYQQKADELMPVDCLLPGVVRKLGSQMTYVTPRRPIKTTGVDCEIRGGEYVLYDRASYESALAIWQPLADSGDARSQNYVGEIYEKGLGVAPDYNKAAEWYGKAAKQDYAPAQINLGQLYERGFGVPRDMEKALAWYRRAANIEGKILKFVSFDYSDEQIADMQRTIDRNASETAGLNQKIQQLVKKLDEANAQKALAQKKFEQEQRAIANERQQLASQQKLLADHQAQTEKIREELKLQLAAQQAEMERAKQEQLAKIEAENKDKKNAIFNIQFPKVEIKFDKYKLAKLQKQLEEKESEANTLAATLEEKARALAKQEVTLKKKDLELAELAANYEDIQHQLNSSQKALPVVDSENGKTKKVESDMPPTIIMIEPPMLATRGEINIKTRSGVDQRTIIGQVSSQNPLIEVLINDKAVPVDEKGLFQHRVPLTRSKTPVTIVAVDNSGLRANLEFNLEIEKGGDQGSNLYADGATAGKQAQPAHKIPDINFGRYHALVIGNAEYKILPDLETAIADAEAIANVLTDKYGFNVTLLKDATRYDILSALNTLRGNLTEDDNLLIYYAGHGELDKVNTRGHWLPVDAEAESTANWVSNIAVTDLLNAMSVRKVLVVADSCYSGAMTRSTLARLDAGRSEQAWISWLKLNTEQRSRLSFSSGGLEPVLDGGGGRHSVFAKAFLDVLEANNTVVEGHQVHAQVAQAVNYAASAVQFEQAPQYAPIRFAGHEAGDFLFVPKIP